MSYGLFGKLPQKRDFVALGIPRSILEPFESWLQSAVAASRNELGRDWQEKYLVAPMWRYWIGKSILGATCAGALIPSVDGVGRFFPLTLMYFGDLAPPLVAPLDGWYAAIEDRLLSVLDQEAQINVETLTDGLGLPESAGEPGGFAARPFRKGSLWQGEPGEATGLLAELMRSDYLIASEDRSYWWTSGGNSSGSAVYARNAMPDPFFYADMIRGSIE